MGSPAWGTPAYKSKVLANSRRKAVKVKTKLASRPQVVELLTEQRSRLAAATNKKLEALLTKEKLHAADTRRHLGALRKEKLWTAWYQARHQEAEKREATLRGQLAAALQANAALEKQQARLQEKNKQLSADLRALRPPPPKDRSAAAGFDFPGSPLSR